MLHFECHMHQSILSISHVYSRVKNMPPDSVSERISTGFQTIEVHYTATTPTSTALYPICDIRKSFHYFIRPRPIKMELS